MEIASLLALPDSNLASLQLCLHTLPQAAQPSVAPSLYLEDEIQPLKRSREDLNHADPHALFMSFACCSYCSLLPHSILVHFSLVL